MTTKQIAIHAIEELPDDASWDDVQDRIDFVAGVRKGLRELDEGKGIPHDRVKEESATCSNCNYGRSSVRRTG